MRYNYDWKVSQNKFRLVSKIISFFYVCNAVSTLIQTKLTFELQLSLIIWSVIVPKFMFWIMNLFAQTYTKD